MMKKKCHVCSCWTKCEHNFVAIDSLEIYSRHTDGDQTEDGVTKLN